VKQPRKYSFIVAVVVVLALGGAWGLSTLRGASPNIDPSRIAAVEQGTMVRSVVATGKIEPISKVEIKSKANGIIERLLVDVDQIVAPGAVLAELDKENLTARLREARANLQAAEAAQEAAAAQLKKNEIEAESPDVEFARRNTVRAQQLAERQLVSQQGLDEARSALELAQNRQRAASGQLVIARARIAEAIANIAQARAAVERAEEELANALVMTLGDIEKVFVRGRVDEADIGRVRLGQPARITTETFPDRIFNGRVTQISPIGVEKDNVTTFEVEASIDNPGKELKANMTANAEIILEEFPQSLLVPETAVIYDAERKPFVDRLDPASKAGRTRVPVKVGVGNGSKVQILGGVKAGDKIVLPG
jgi:HlyD family secretion protein